MTGCFSVGVFAYFLKLILVFVKVTRVHSKQKENVRVQDTRAEPPPPHPRSPALPLEGHRRQPWELRLLVAPPACLGSRGWLLIAG